MRVSTDRCELDMELMGLSGPAAGGSRQALGNGKFPTNGKKRTRDDEPTHLDYTVRSYRSRFAYVD